MEPFGSGRATSGHDLSADFLLGPTLEDGLPFISERGFIPLVKARHFRHQNRPLLGATP